MKTAVVLALLLCAAPARAQGWGFDRVDVLSEDPAFFLNYEIPGGSTYVVRPALRFLEQVKPVWTTPWKGVTIGTALATQSVVYERAIPAVRGLFWSAGVQTQLLCPRGLVGGVAYRIKRFRFAAGLSLVSGAAWSNLRGFGTWDLLPAIGIGVGRRFDGEAAPTP